MISYLVCLVVFWITTPGSLDEDSRAMILRMFYTLYTTIDKHSLSLQLSFNQLQMIRSEE